MLEVFRGMKNMPNAHRVVIIGGGFGGLSAAVKLKRAPAPSDPAGSLQLPLISATSLPGGYRRAFARQYCLASAYDSEQAKEHRGAVGRGHGYRRREPPRDSERRRPRVRHLGHRHRDRAINILATTSGNKFAPGLKTIEDATDMRRRILLAFEAAEREPDPEKLRAWMTFVIVGGGP